MLSLVIDGITRGNEVEKRHLARYVQESAKCVVGSATKLSISQLVVTSSTGINGTLRKVVSRE